MKKEIANISGRELRPRQDIEDTTYRLIQRLEQSEKGIIYETIEVGDKKATLNCSYKTQFGKIGRTTADLIIVIGALLQQNNYHPRIKDINYADLLRHLKKADTIPNRLRLKKDLKIIQSLGLSVDTEEKTDEGQRDQQLVVIDLQINLRKRKGNYILCSDNFINRVKEKFMVHLPPADVFFQLTAPQKYVCERLIARIQPIGKGKERKFKREFLQFGLDTFSENIIGYHYKMSHKKREATKNTLEHLNFLVKKYTLKKERIKGDYKVYIWFYTYKEYIKNVEALKKQSKYYEEPPQEEILELFPDETKKTHEIVFEMMGIGVEESKAIEIWEKGFDIVDIKKRNDVIETEIKYSQYIRQKIELYKHNLRKGREPEDLTGWLYSSLQGNYGNIHVEKEKIANEKIKENNEKEAKIKALEKRKNIIEEKWEKEIRSIIDEVIEQNPEIVEEIQNELDATRDWKNPLYDKTLTPLDNYKSKLLIRFDIDAKIIERNDTLKSMVEQRDRELAEIE